MNKETQTSPEEQPPPEPEDRGRFFLIPVARLRKISKLALPITGSMMAVNILILVDAAMVGRLGNVALAAVGLGGLASSFTTAIILGLGSAVQAQTARRVGEQSDEPVCRSLHAGILTALFLGIPLAFLAILVAPDLFRLIEDDPAVRQAGIPYLIATLVAAPAMGVTFSFRGFWNGIGKPGYYLLCMVTMVSANIVGNYLLIFGKFGAPELGVLGAGVASTSALYLGALVHHVLGFLHARGYGFYQARPTWHHVKALLRLSLPTGLQQILATAGYLIFFALVGAVGTAELAATTVIFRVAMVAVLPAMGLGLAGATLVGQALGRKEPEGAARWGRDVTLLAFTVLTLIGLPMLIVPHWVLAIFISEPETIAVAAMPLRLVGGTIGLNGLGPVLMYLLLGAGDNRRVMQIGVSMQWAVMLPAVWLVGPVLKLNLTQIWLAYVGYSTLVALVYGFRWQGGRWKTLKV